MKLEDGTAEERTRDADKGSSCIRSKGVYVMANVPIPISGVGTAVARAALDSRFWNVHSLQLELVVGFPERVKS